MVLAAAVMATAAVVVGRQLERLASQPAEHVQLRDELATKVRRHAFEPRDRLAVDARPWRAELLHCLLESRAACCLLE